MSQDRFYNYYVETLNSTLQDAVGKNLVFQTQARIAKEDQEQLNATINELVAKLEEYSSIEESVSSQKDLLNLKDMEIQNITRERDHARSEASHIETFRSELVSARQEIQQKNVEIQRLKSGLEKELSSAKQESDKILRDCELKFQKEIKELKEKIDYLEMTPAQKRKFNAANTKQDKIILKEDIKNEYVEKEDIKVLQFDDAEGDLNKDGGTF